jgi:uncharacterized membrane protein
MSSKKKDGRREQAHVALSDDELAALDRIAEREGISRSDVLRRAAFHGPSIEVGTKRRA